MDRQGQTGTRWDRKDGRGQTGTDRDRQGQTGRDRERQGQTGTDMNRQGQTGTDRERQGHKGTERDGQALSLLVSEKIGDKTVTKPSNTEQGQEGTTQQKKNRDKPSRPSKCL